ncbi:CD4-1 molecule [Genypterus blacodes]|uniref:CD4-1 molecule n=1 Tax=Genypterus blacodes TaxID=154954 RepID=UPI003F76836A
MKSFIQSLLVFLTVLISTEGAEVVVYAQLGGKVTFQIIPSTTIPMNKLYVSWHFRSVGTPQLASRNPLGSLLYSQDAQWASRVSIFDNSLTIKTLKEGDFGTFICRQSGHSKPESIDTYRLSKLSASLSPGSPVLAGERVTLACIAATPPGHPRPQIHWLNPQGAQRAANPSGELIVRVSGPDQGDWTCVLTQSDKRQSQVKVHVDVLDLSPAPPHPLYTSVSSPLSIPCSILPQASWDQLKAKGVHGGQWRFSPKADATLTSGDSQRLFSLSLEDTHTWNTVQDRGLRASDPSKNILSLHRDQAAGTDRGQYNCSLEFPNDVELKRTVDVEVLEILSSPGTQLIFGQQLNLTCSLGHALTSDLEVRWFPPGRLTLPSLGHAPGSAHLTVPEVGVGHNGTWRCELWQSEKRLTSATIVLRIEAKLSVWMLVTICGASVIFILLLVLTVIFIRRHRQKKTQRRVRQPRHRFCQCKHPKPKGFYRT